MGQSASPLPAPAPPGDELIRKLTSAVLAPEYRFPTLPGTAADILRLANAAEVAFRDVDRVVRRDPIIAARVLAVANSPAFSPRSRVMSLRTSMMVLGWNNLRDVLWQVVAEAHVFRGGGNRRMLQRLRLHAVATAHITRMLCREISVDSEYAFVCGLLHDIGRPLALEMLTADSTVGAETLDEVLTAAHTQVGCRVADAWNLPAEVAAVARDHHGHLEGAVVAAQPGDPPMSLVVAAAEQIGNHHGLGAEPVAVDPADAAIRTLFARLGLDSADIESLILRTEDLRSRIL